MIQFICPWLKTEPLTNFQIAADPYINNTKYRNALKRMEKLSVLLKQRGNKMSIKGIRK